MPRIANSHQKQRKRHLALLQSLLKEPTLVTPWLRIFGLPNCERINFCCSCHLIYGDWFQQAQEMNMLPKRILSGCSTEPETVWPLGHMYLQMSLVNLQRTFYIKSGSLASFENLEALAMPGLCPNLARIGKHLALLDWPCLLQSPLLYLPPSCICYMPASVGIWVCGSCKCIRIGGLGDRIFSVRMGRICSK